MSADLHIHAMTDDMTEEHLASFFGNTLGSKWFSVSDMDRWEEAWEKVANSPNTHVGQVSWLKASLMDDGEEEWVPDSVAKVSEIIGEDLPVLDEDLKREIMDAIRLPNRTRYTRMTDPEEIEAWLDANMGRRLFTVNW